MKITILTDNPQSWVMNYVEELKEILSDHTVNHIYNSDQIEQGDLMLILSCEKILTQKHLSFHQSNIVVHPSKVPHGKGWSPLAWQILEGLNKIPVSLFEAVEAVDAGDVYLVENIELEGHELNDEIKNKQGKLMIQMIKTYIDNFSKRVAKPQTGQESFYPKRKKNDNRLDVNKTIKEQFNLLRIVDNDRYPAFFELNGHTYIIKITKAE
jgi:methionyl-tRNA formyltransferase